MASPTPNRLSAQLSPFEAASGRQSPFRRQNSQSPATNMRTGTPASSPTKASFALSPSKTTSLSPEKSNPFTRRPSQINHHHAADRPTSPFARPTSSLSIVSSPSRKISNDSLKSPREPPRSPLRRPTATPESQKAQSRPASVAPEEPDDSTARPISPSPYDGTRHYPSTDTLSDDSSFSPTPVQALSRDNLRPAMHRNPTSSATTATLKQPQFSSPANSSTPSQKLQSFASGGGARAYHHHLPPPLLHSMRESFEVLDSTNTGTVSSASIATMLAQLGLDPSPRALQPFFPPHSPTHLNLARYLDILSGPLASLSAPAELRAAFEAFDVDDSGQIDLAVLREALVHTAPEAGEDDPTPLRLSERDVDGILGEFAGRRAFGSKGVHAAGTAKGEVFRYRDFMASVSGGGAGAGGEVEAAVAA